MSVADQIQALNDGLLDAYDAVQTKGGTVPASKNLDNLPTAINSIPAGGVEPSSGATLTAYDSTTGVLTGTSLGTSGTVYLLDRDTHTYVAQPTSAWSDTSITLTTPVDLSTLEGTTSIGVVGTDGKWSTKLLLTGEVAVAGWAKLYVQNPDTKVVRTITIDNSTDFNKLYSPDNGYSREITIAGDTFYTDEVVGMQFGSDFTGTSLSSQRFLAYMGNLNQPISVPSSVTSIGNCFLQNCYSFNQPLDMSSITSIGVYFLSGCSAFNQPIDISSVTSIGNYFLSGCSAFNQPIDISSVTSIGDCFLQNCYSFNQPLDMSSITSIGNNFLYYCYSFNQPLTIPSSITSIGNNFLSGCSAFNQPIDISSVTSIGNYFLRNCYSFNQSLTIPSSVTSIDDYFLQNCYSFNQPLDISSATSIGDCFLQNCYSFNQPLDMSSITSIGNCFLQNCYSFNQPLDMSSITSIGNNFLYCCYSFSDLTVQNSVSPTDNNSLSTNYNTAKIYVNGIAVKGSGADTWITNLPNRTSRPYRKLINGNIA